MKLVVLTRGLAYPSYALAGCSMDKWVPVAKKYAEYAQRGQQFIIYDEVREMPITIGQAAFCHCCYRTKEELTLRVLVIHNQPARSTK